MSFSLSYQLDEVDTTLLGLLGSWHTPPVWFVDALRSTTATQCDEMIRACRERHLIGLLESHCRHAGLWDEILPDAQRAIRRENIATSLMNQAMLQSAAEIFLQAQTMGIEPILLKGCPNSLLLYDHPIERVVMDVDLLVTPEEALPMSEIIEGMGYEIGKFDWQTRRFSKGSKNERKVSPGAYELPRQWKIVPIECSLDVLQNLGDYCESNIFIEGGKVWVPVSVEVHYALAPRLVLPRDKTFIDVTPLEGCLSLDWQINFLYICYKVYTDLIIFGARKGAKLFADAIRMLSRKGTEIDLERVFEIAVEFKVLAPVMYVVAHAIQTFGVEDNGAIRRIERWKFDEIEPIDLGDILPQILRGRPVAQLQFTGHR